MATNDDRLESALSEFEAALASDTSLDLDRFFLAHPEFADLDEELRARTRLSFPNLGEQHSDSDAETQLYEPAGSDSDTAHEREDEDDLPREFGRYVVIRRLGRGAMGRVYLVEDRELGRRVALKVPTIEGGSRGERWARFRREARAAAALRHPNVCPVHDVGEHDGRPYLTMAYVEGRTLSALLEAEGPLEDERAVEIVLGIARGLRAAHAAGIVHRDLKPANVMIDPTGQPIVMDFGLAHVDDDPAVHTVDGALLGTPAYMAPEQIDDEYGTVGPGTDQYALGVTLFRLLTGELPFGGRMGSVLSRVLTTPVPSPRSIRSTVHPALESICLRMAAKRAEDRFPNLDALIDVLEEHLRGPSRSGRFPRTSVAIALGLVVAGLGTLAAYWPEEPPPEGSGDVPVADGSGHAPPGPLDANNSGTPIVEPEGPPLWTLADGPAGEVFVLADAHPGGVLGIDVSRDGSRMLTGGADGVVRLREVATGRLVHELDGHEDAVRRVRFSNDGRWGLSASADGTSVLWDLASGEAERTHSGHTDMVTGVAFLEGSSDGITPRFVTASLDRTLGVWHAASDVRERRLGYPEDAIPDIRAIRDVRTLAAHVSWVRDVAATPDGSRFVSAGNDTLLLGWNTANLEVDTWFTGHEAPVTSVTISPDGTRVLSTAYDDTAILWTITGTRLATLRGHESRVLTAAFSPDGRFAVTGGQDETVRLWRLADGRELRRFDGHAGGVNGIVWLSGHGGRLIVTAELGGALRIRRLPALDEGDSVD